VKDGSVFEHGKKCVSGWHYHAYGQIPPSLEAENGPELLLRLCDEQTTLITGGPLHNLGQCLRLVQERNLHAFRPGRLVAQGGFAGEVVVPEERQLGKFKGRRTCPTFNLNGAPQAAIAVLASSSLQKRVFASKNVCHRVFYDRRLHASFQETKDTCVSHALIWQGMDHYLRRHPGGKLLHDPLAACCAIDERIGTWAEVELYSEQGEWGARFSPDSHTWIITDYDHEHFLKILTMD
jgi:pyrimidine-specific ribonucleoside hydrolase